MRTRFYMVFLLWRCSLVTLRNEIQRWRNSFKYSSPTSRSPHQLCFTTVSRNLWDTLNNSCIVRNDSGCHCRNLTFHYDLHFSLLCDGKFSYIWEFGCRKLVRNWVEKINFLPHVWWKFILFSPSILITSVVIYFISSR